jgi:hypothetical protein
MKKEKEKEKLKKKDIFGSLPFYTQTSCVVCAWLMT